MHAPPFRIYSLIRYCVGTNLLEPGFKRFITFLSLVFKINIAHSFDNRTVATISEQYMQRLAGTNIFYIYDFPITMWSEHYC